MNTLEFTNDLGSLNLTGMLVCKATSAEAPAGTPVVTEAVVGVFETAETISNFRGIVTVIPADDDDNLFCVHVQNLDDSGSNFYLGSRWTRRDLFKSEIFGLVNF